MTPLSFQGYSAISKQRIGFYRCPHCLKLMERLWCGPDKLATCWNCNQKNAPDAFREAWALRWVATCQHCRDDVPLTGGNFTGHGFYICAGCNNVVAARLGQAPVAIGDLLSLNWNSRLIERAASVDGTSIRIARCRSKCDFLVTRLLFLMAEAEEHPFKYGQDQDHKAALFFDDDNYLGYMLWTDNEDTAISTSPLVLRQLFVRPEVRGRGVASGAVKHWVENIASPVADTFLVESPNEKSIGLLVKLGYAERTAEGTVRGIKCGFTHGW